MNSLAIYINSVRLNFLKKGTRKEKMLEAVIIEVSLVKRVKGMRQCRESGSPTAGSGSSLGMRIRIQEGKNDKKVKKFQVLKCSSRIHRSLTGELKSA